MGNRNALDVGAIEAGGLSKKVAKLTPLIFIMG